MTWKEAKKIAGDHLESMRAPGGPFSGEHPLPGVIQQSDYESQEDYTLLRQEDGAKATLEEFRMINTAFARLVRAEFGIRTVKRVLKAADYLRWLAAQGRKNNAESRALYTALKK